jgi:D-isomer specific 2-hydroxyacid dehydrogenase, NAD binding domain
VAQVTVNVPLTKSTRGMIDASAIKRMKKGAYLVRPTTHRRIFPKRGQTLYAVSYLTFLHLCMLD